MIIRVPLNHVLLFFCLNKKNMFFCSYVFKKNMFLCSHVLTKNHVLLSQSFSIPSFSSSSFLSTTRLSPGSMS